MRATAAANERIEVVVSVAIGVVGFVTVVELGLQRLELLKKRRNRREEDEWGGETKIRKTEGGKQRWPSGEVNLFILGASDSLLLRKVRLGWVSWVAPACLIVDSQTDSGPASDAPLSRPPRAVPSRTVGPGSPAPSGSYQPE